MLPGAPPLQHSQLCGMGRFGSLQGLLRRASLHSHAFSSFDAPRQVNNAYI